MKREVHDTRDELIRFIEQELGWNVVQTRADQDDNRRYDDEPIELELEIRARKEIEKQDTNDYRLK